MIVAIILAQGRPLTTTESLVVGGLFFLSGIALAYGTLFHWQWMKKRLGWMLRWGRDGWGFPASRVGMIYASLTGMILGTMVVGDGMKWRPPVDGGFFFIGVVVWMLLGAGIAVRDYFLHLNNKDGDDGDE